MALPIGETPILKGKEANRFLDIVQADMKKPARPIPTPNLHKVQQLIKDDAQRRQKHLH
jgi:hypothetical protein